LRVSKISLIIIKGRLVFKRAIILLNLKVRFVEDVWLLINFQLQYLFNLVLLNDLKHVLILNNSLRNFFLIFYVLRWRFTQRVAVFDMLQCLCTIAKALIIFFFYIAQWFIIEVFLCINLFHYINVGSFLIIYNQTFIINSEILRINLILFKFLFWFYRWESLLFKDYWKII
jgi:hypothetical protein